MRWLFVFLITGTLVGLAQQAPLNVQVASSGVCSPNVVSNEGPVSITCNAAMDKATVTKIVFLLNQILHERSSSDEVNRKLDSIMEFLQTNMNPNRPVTTYDCGGNSSMSGRAAGIGMSVTAVLGGPAAEAFQKMVLLRDSHQYSDLLLACNGQIKIAPEWLTPRLFCGLAHLAMGHEDEVKEDLRYYDQRAGPAYDGDSRCKTMFDFLHAHIQP